MIDNTDRGAALRAAPRSEPDGSPDLPGILSMDGRTAEEQAAWLTRWDHQVAQGLRSQFTAPETEEARRIGRQIAAAVATQIQAECHRLEEELTRIPAEDLHLYEVRVRVHADGSRSSQIARRDEPAGACECQVCSQGAR